MSQAQPNQGIEAQEVLHRCGDVLNKLDALDQLRMAWLPEETIGCPDAVRLAEDTLVIKLLEMAVASMSNPVCLPEDRASVISMLLRRNERLGRGLAGIEAEDLKRHVEARVSSREAWMADALVQKLQSEVGLGVFFRDADEAVAFGWRNPASSYPWPPPRGRRNCCKGQWVGEDLLSVIMPAAMSILSEGRFSLDAPERWGWISPAVAEWLSAICIIGNCGGDPLGISVSPKDWERFGTQGWIGCACDKSAVHNLMEVDGRPVQDDRSKLRFVNTETRLEN
ncbi:MAG: hypothetical protein HY360_14550 [Verrucomicrobia bacterium]|nr:hypothetical protein [Verrucomicrobiota bacterium]